MNTDVPGPKPDCNPFVKDCIQGVRMPRLYQVDAFTNKAFGGNPAAVCLLDHEEPESWMQSVAAEMNLAETAFVFPAGEQRFRLRWFTPVVEVDLCGHATLATSHVLWETGAVPADLQCVYDTLSGELRARQVSGRVELDFPQAAALERPAPEGLVEALGAAPRFVGLSRHDWLAVFDSAAQIRQMQPSRDGLRQLGVRGVIVTAADESGEFDFVSRFFAPGAGIDEDPVTGSAHCTLGPWWSAELGKTEFRAYQASPRGGVVELELAGDRVLLRGEAVTVLAGELLV